MFKVCIELSWNLVEASLQFRVIFTVHSLSRVWLFVTTSTAERRASLSFPVYWSLLKLMSIESVLPSNHLILCCPLSSIRVFSSLGPDC